MVKDSYLSRKAQTESILKKQKRTDFTFSLLRLIAFLLFLLFFYLALYNNQPNYFIPTSVFLILFFWMLKKHQKVRLETKRLKTLVQINEDEISYLEGKLDPFDEGSDYIDPNHLYAVDLDIFGENSLFAHINRTSTLVGRKRLAEELANPTMEDINKKQEAIKELSQKFDWRQNFAVHGKLMDENPNLHTSINYWLKKDSRKNWVVSARLLYPLGFICVSLLLYWFYDTTVQNFYWLLLAFGVNLGLVFSQMKRINAEAEILDDIATSMNKYSNLLENIENLELKSELLASLKSKIATKAGKASSNLNELGKILSGFDQLDNLVVRFFANGIYHYHLHLLRGLYDWKAEHAANMLLWLEVIAEFDKWNSIANYVYNHPEFSFPEVTAQKEMKAEQFGHPFLSREKRIDNNISFEDASFVILTGSNMSGKSTFLRAVGINLILMQIGSSVCASKMKTFPFKVLTSMRQLDSLASGESYFQAEVLRLKKIKNVLDSGKNCFVLLDEILRGTNSEDKRKGTELFLENISGSNSFGIVATHDIDIADLAEKYPETFMAKFFESKVQGGKLTFDYKLRKGVCTTPNAIDLMKTEGII